MDGFRFPVFHPFLGRRNLADSLGSEKGDRAENFLEQNALDIAKIRYARGEINKEQFEQLKKDLM